MFERFKRLFNKFLVGDKVRCVDNTEFPDMPVGSEWEVYGKYGNSVHVRNLKLKMWIATYVPEDRFERVLTIK